MDTDPSENVLKNVKAGYLSTTLLIIGSRNYRENYIKTGQKNNLTDPIAWI